MKKLFTAFLACMMLAGCAQTPAEEPEETAEATAEAAAETEQTETEELLGGWTVNTDYNTLLTDDETARFETALAGLTGVGYTPIQVIATQVVSGTNYAYLAMGTSMTAEPKEAYYVLVVYENLAGEVSLTSIKQIDIADIKTKENAGEPLMGGWTPTDTGKAGMLPGEEAQVSFDTATEELLGVMLNPIVLFGSQVVAGTNYAALCRGRTETEEPALNLYVTKWCDAADGVVEVLENEIFDLEYYVTPEVSEAEPFVGDWELTAVIAAEPGGDPTDMDPEENASLFGDPAYYTFNADGTGSLNVLEGENTETIEGTWVQDPDMTYTFTPASGDELNLSYDAETDTLVREYADDSKDAKYSVIQFIYTRK